VTEWLEVNDWMDLVANAYIGLVLVAIAAIPSWLTHRSHKTIRDIKDQVVNSHPSTNLRDDLDRAIAAIEHMAEEIRADVRALKKDLMAEEDHRRLQINDLRDELEHRTGKNRRI
jgi:hypothetical protein